MTDLTQTEDFLEDLGSRAGKTFVQTFVSSAATLYVASGLHVASLQDLATDKKALLALAASAGAAALSATWNSTLAYLKAHKADEETLATEDLETLRANMGRSK